MTTILSLFLSLFGAVQDPVKERLEKSPRHHEWVEVRHGERTVACFLVFPEVKEKAAAVLVIHENKGLTDWVRSAADQVAEAGYIAIAPDLLSGAGPGGKNTDAFASPEDATKAIYALKPDQVTSDLNAVADHVTKLPASSGKLAVAGFCWGGMQTFRFATNRGSLAAAFVFYGTGPEDPSAIAKITCPIYGFYGGNDARVNATIEKSAALMKEAGKTYEPVTYPGAGHGFMRAGGMPGAKAEDQKARAEAWTRLKELLKKL